MLRSLRKTLAILAVSLGILGAFAVPAVAGAAASGDQITGNLCGGAELKLATGDCGPEGTQKIENIIVLIVNIFSAIVGIVAVIMIIYGGFKYITSGGDSNNVSSAKNTIIFAVVGLIVVALAQFIVRFVLDKAVNTPGV